MSHKNNLYSNRPVDPEQPSSDLSDAELIDQLEDLRPVPERDPFAAALSKARFMAELKELKMPKTRSSFFSRFEARLQKIKLISRKKEEDNAMALPAQRFAFTSLAMIAMIVGFLFGGAGTTVYAAENALPGDALYPVKMTLEQTQATLSRDARQRAELYMQFSDRRLNEISALIAGGRYKDISSATNEFETYISRAAGELELVSKSSPDKSAALTRQISASLTRYALALSRMKDKLPDDVRVELEHAIEATHSNRSAQDTSQDVVEIVGTIDAIGNGTITIAGHTYILNANSEVKGSLKAGDSVKMRASANSDGSLVIQKMEAEGHLVVTPEPGDAKSNNTSEIGDDHGNHGTEIVDDHGNNKTENSDDKGGDGTQIGDDTGGDGTQMEDNHGGSGSLNETHGGSDDGSNSQSSGSSSDSSSNENSGSGGSGINDSGVDGGHQGGGGDGHKGK